MAPIVSSAQPTLPLLHYNGTSGWSGSDTSEDQTAYRDASGLTSRVQAQVLDYVTLCKRYGCTVKDLREDCPELGHHGRVSSALSSLHKGGYIARLAAVRDRCHVYVAPDYIEGRTTQRRGQNAQKCDDHHPCPTCGR